MMKARTLLWLFLALPAAWIGTAFATSSMTYGEALSLSGLVSAWLLAATLAISPLKSRFPSLMRDRRALGVAMFGYAALHLAIYLTRKWPEAVAKALDPDILTGWVALALALPLALTSTNGWVRRLRKRWGVLHRLVYAVAVLTALHWILTAFDPTTAYVFAAIIAALLLVRAYRSYR